MSERERSMKQLAELRSVVGVFCHETKSKLKQTVEVHTFTDLERMSVWEEKLSQKSNIDVS